VNLEPGFTVIDRSDSADLFDNLRQELGYTEQYQRFPRKDTCLAIYSWRVNTQKSLHDTLEQQFNWCLNWEQDLAKLCRTYVERKQRYGLLDYDDLLIYWHALMNEPKLAQHVAANFDHVLVDEYQDTNRLQGEILKGMRPDGSGITVVGDDAQSIYSFRGAAVENILGFPDTVYAEGRDHHAGAELPLHAADPRRIECVDGRRAAPASQAPALDPRRRRRPQYTTTDDLQSQADYVCGQILKRREAGVLLRKQAVLFRNASASDVLEVELLRRKDSVREVRRPEVPRGRARQGHAGGAALGGQPAQHDGGVPRAAAAARHGPGQCAAHRRRCSRRAAATSACSKRRKRPRPRCRTCPSSENCSLH
jgi:DNA helicase-2/ATP-dependent DNA helicase PcrA